MEGIIFVGLQAAGKSTFYRERFFHSHVRISMDLLRTRYREQLILEACLKTQQPFVVDNTNPTVEDRARYIPQARQRGYGIVGYFFESEVAACLARNLAREHTVPEVGLFSTAKCLELPRYEEGFDELYLVRIAGEGRFEVEDWADEIR